MVQERLSTLQLSILRCGHKTLKLGVLVVCPNKALHEHDENYRLWWMMMDHCDHEHITYSYIYIYICTHKWLILDNAGGEWMTMDDNGLEMMIIMIMMIDRQSMIDNGRWMMIDDHWWQLLWLWLLIHYGLWGWWGRCMMLDRDARWIMAIAVVMDHGWWTLMDDDDG